jgi:hypothetical protein
VYAWWKLEESPIPFLRMSAFRVSFLLMLVSSLPGNSQALDHDSCMHTTRVGSAATKTLFSTLVIPVQAPLLGHAPRAIPPQCTFIMVNIFLLTPSVTLKSNGWRSEASPALRNLLARHRFTTLKGQYLYTVMYVL